jgi:hypothetical protein
VRGLLHYLAVKEESGLLKPARPTLMGPGNDLGICMSCPHNVANCGFAVRGLGVPDAWTGSRICGLPDALSLERGVATFEPEVITAFVPEVIAGRERCRTRIRGSCQY